MTTEINIAGKLMTNDIKLSLESWDVRWKQSSEPLMGKIIHLQNILLLLCKAFKFIYGSAYTFGNDGNRHIIPVTACRGTRRLSRKLDFGKSVRSIRLLLAISLRWQPVTVHTAIANMASSGWFCRLVRQKEVSFVVFLIKLGLVWFLGFSSMSKVRLGARDWG